MGRFSCFLVGDDTLTHRCGEMLVAGGHDVRGVITDAADVRTWADENELPVVGHDEDPLALVTAEPFDYLFSIANLKILSDELVARAQVGTINFHDGPLPAYAGVHSTSWALMNGEPRHGVSWVYVTDVIDGGAIAAARAVEITEDETSFSLNTKCFEAGMETFEQLIGGLADGTNAPQEQDLARRSYFGMWKRPTAAGLIRWDRPASELRSLVRALDLGPTHTNILGVAKVAIGDTAFIVRQAETGPDHASAAPGTVLDITDDAIVVGAVDGSLAITELASLAGEALAVDGVCAATGLEIGQRLPVIGDEDADAIDARLSSVSRHERTWERELAAARLVELPYIDATAEPSDETTDHSVTVAADFAALADERWPDCTLPEATAAAFLLYLVRLGADQTLTVGLHADAGPDGRLFASRVPWNGSIDTAEPAWSQLDAVLTTLATVTAAGTHLRDLAARMPALRGRDIDPDAYPIAVDLGRTAEGAVSTDGAAVTLRVTGADISLVSRNGVVDPDDGARMATQFGTFLAGLANDADRPLHQLPLLTAAEAEEILTEWNRTQGDYPTDETIPSLFAAQVERTPDAVALAYREDEITYRELDRRSSQLANRLVELGVGRDVVVAISVDRSIEMVVSLLAVHKAGGAYLPLDPSYPKERIAFILEDASAAVLISSSDLVHTLPHHNGDVVLVDTDSELIATYADDIDVVVAPDQLAYVIYTSGSTGKPKGVMVEHGNAVSFFWGMDERIPHQEGDVWLAVTSLSFDISVLEIFWTLCRGLKVVIYNNDLAMSQERTNAAVGTPIDFSVFYFSADAGENPDDKYRLLIEGAKFADANGFTAVWTPERHFHEFGGLYPNPAVTGAAVAMITESVQIRSGSVVAPLHSPIRIAEEWSVVDNLSRGRAAIAFASGWMPEDFVIRPDDFDDKKGATFSHLETVRKLWRGEAVDFPAPNGETVAVQTLPRPIQPELPVWVTTAGNPETYEAAARAGAHVLTHLLGQSVEEVGEKVAIYRQAWREAGHPGNGHISLMVHTLVGADHDDVREIVREPLKEYLRTAANLLKTYSSAFPTFRNQGINAEDVNFGALPDEDLEAVLDFAFLRYIETSGLFGTPESSMDLIDRIRDNDIDEVACLIDFGVPTDVVLDNLPHLDRLRAATNATAEDADESIASLIGRHDVTHFQCTPSMARMLLTDEPTCAAMSTLEVMMVGGEACSVSLAEELLATVEGRVINMYGPTETTIWSGTQVLLGEDGPVPIGRPILNTHFFVVNEEMQAQPVGVPGELLIGGPGVTRGYLNREALTAERFIASPFAVDGSPTLYRTGDLVRYLPDSRVEFIGRIDHQVKIRGHRIELGEIETCINHHPSVREAVVMAREDVPGDLRLVAYVTTVQHADVSPTDIRDHVRDRLPEYMVPSRVVALDEFPQTPNKKVDRKALPAPGDDPQDAGDALESPTGVIEETIASLWSDVLGIATLGRHDDFFELGGDSLSLVHVTARISDVFEQKVSIGAFVTAPTIAAVASLIDGPAADQASGAAPAADVDAPGVTTTRPMREDDLDAVIGLHEQHFPDWAVTMLGSGFLRQMYHWYMESHGDLAIVAARDGAVTGFTVGTVGPYKARLLRFALPEAVRGVATNPIDLLRHRVGSIRGNKTNGEPATEDPRMDDPTLANNRIMAVSPGDSDSALALLVAFEKAAAQRGTEPFFHDDVPTG